MLPRLTPLRASIVLAAALSAAGLLPGVLAALTVVFLAAAALCPAAADAHGIKGRASLPVPAYLFAWAAAIVLVLSFVVLSAMWSTPRLQEPHERRRRRWPAALCVPAGAIGL